MTPISSKMATLFRNMQIYNDTYESIIKTKEWDIAKPVDFLSKYEIPQTPNEPSGKSIDAEFEAINLNLYAPNANMVGFRVRNKDRLIGWIHCLAYRYYALLGEDEDYEVQWTDRQCAHNKDLHDEIQIQIFENNQEKRKVVTIHIFFTTFLITVQGTTYEEWARFEFQYLKGLVDGLCGENVDKLLQYLHVDEDIDELSDAETELKLPANSFEHGNKSASFTQLDLLQASLIKTVEKLEASQESNTVAIIEAIKGIHTPNKIDVSQTQIPVLETKLKVLQSENSELKSQLNHEKDARCELKNLITSTRGEIDYLYDKIAQKNDHAESLELRNKHLSEMLSQTQDELFEVKSSAQRVERGPPEQHAMPAAAASLQQPAQDVGNTVLLLGTSNVENISESKLSHATTVVKEITYTIKEASDYIRTTDMHAPQAVLLHILTNDLKTYDPVSCVTNLDEVIELIKSKWPNVKIIVSLTTPRTDNLNNQTNGQIINAMLKQKFLQGGSDVCIIEHNNMLYSDGNPNKSLLREDGYHLTDRGVSNLAQNFRNAIHDVLNIQTVATQRDRSRSRYGNYRGRGGRGSRGYRGRGGRGGY